MRVIVRRERPHPGAQLSLFEERDGWRYQAFVTNTTTGQLAFLEARHRAHARVEDRIRHAKDSGLGRFPSREFEINRVWLEVPYFFRTQDPIGSYSRGEEHEWGKASFQPGVSRADGPAVLRSRRTEDRFAGGP
jgi:hypothetical protein